jgi:hypothetical protein
MFSAIVVRCPNNTRRSKIIFGDKIYSEYIFLTKIKTKTEYSIAYSRQKA